jgi:hypothetical protein
MAYGEELRDCFGCENIKVMAAAHGAQIPRNEANKRNE